MSSILDALRRIEREEDGRTTAPFNLGPEEPPSGSRRRWLWIGGTVAIVGSLSAGLWFLGDESSEGVPDAQELAQAPEPEPDRELRKPHEDTVAGHTPDREGRDHQRGARAGRSDRARGDSPRKQAEGQRARRKARRQAAAQRKARKAVRTDRTPEPSDRPGETLEEPTTPPVQLAGVVPGQPRAVAPSAPAPSAPTPPAAPQAAPARQAAPAPAPEPGAVAEQTTAWKRPFLNPPPSEEGNAPQPDSPPALAAPDPAIAAPSQLHARADDADTPIVLATAPSASAPDAVAPSIAAPEGADAGTPLPTVQSGGGPADTDRRREPRSRAKDPTRTSRIERLEELKRRRSIPRDLAPAAPDIPTAEPEAPIEDEEPGEELLQRPPSGAPHVRVNFLFYSRETTRRRIMVTVDQGSLVTLFEGQSVDTLAVERILPNEVHFRYEGKLFAVHPRY